MEAGQEGQLSLRGAAASAVVQPSPNPRPLSHPEGREVAPNSSYMHSLGQHANIKPLCNKQQLVPWCLKLFAFLSEGPRKKSRPRSSWENMLQKEN